MTELSHDQLRRVLFVFEFNGCDELFWRKEDGELHIWADCSDFFSWGTSDVEPIETEADVLLLEACRSDLAAASSDQWPSWIGELYAARRRPESPASFMLAGGKYALDAAVQALFPTADSSALVVQEDRP